MAVKIRLRKTGRNNGAAYRVVATDSRSPRDGKFLELLGWYDPRKRVPGKNFHLDQERIAHWVGTGAQLSETVASLVKRAKKDAAAQA
ncbi:MAG: 30S ribosomal protein S16 [Kiritimatiellaeota bacterium]|nr:30S ribosomal protein S16 [Kiritimatiellota bacterium]